MPSNNLYGFPQPLSQVFPAPIIAQRAPTSSDIAYPIGQSWIDEVGDDAYILVDVTAASATWVVSAASAGEIATLTGDSGGAVAPSAGNVDLLGTASEIVTTGTANTITWSLPAAIIAPGSLATTTSLQAGTTLTSAGATTLATTGASVNTFGNATGATSVTVTSGTGGISLASTGTGDIAIDSDDTLLLDADGVLELNSSAGVISIGNDADNQNINLGTAGTRTIAIGSSAATETVLGTCNINASGAAVTTIGTGGTGAVNIGNATGNTAVTGSLTASTSLTATAGDITATLGNVVINGAAKQLRCHGGAVTDFIGQATLNTGTVTVLNTNIAAADKIFVSRQGINGSTALGVFNVAITPATSFSITALKTSDATTETNDASIVDYFIVRQV